MSDRLKSAVILVLVIGYVVGLLMRVPDVGGLLFLAVIVGLFF